MSEHSKQPIRWGLTIRFILIGASIFALYANAFSVLAPEYNRMVHWGLLATAAFLIYRRDRSTLRRPSRADVALAALTTASTAFILLDRPHYIQRTDGPVYVPV